MEALKSSFLPSSVSPRKQATNPAPQSIVICSSVSPDPWSLSDGNLSKPKPKSKNPKNPLPDDNARRIMKGKAEYLSVLRRNQGSDARTPRWIKRTPEQMVQYLEDDRNGHLYGRHVVAAIKKVRSLSGMPQGSYDIRIFMASFVAKLTFREMCTVLKEQKGWRQVRDFFHWMKLQLSYRPSVIVYTIVLRAYGQVGKVKLAEQTFLEMLQVGCQPDEIACGTMLCTYARWGRHKAMLSFYSAVEERGVTPTTAVFNFMLSSLQKKALHEDVIYMWTQMTNKKVCPNQFTYTIVIGSFVKRGLANEALKTFTEMNNLGLVPEEATYSLLISLNSKNGDRENALGLYEDMRSRRIIPSNFTCASLLTLYYKDGDYSKALSLFSEMETYGIAADEVIYGLLIRIYGKLGLYEDAERTFREIENLGLLKDDKTYTTMAQVHLYSGDVDKALITIEQMKSRNIFLSRFAHIIQLRCYSVKGDVAAAELAFYTLAQSGVPDCSSCNYMLNLYMRFSLTEKAKHFVLHIRKGHVEFDEELLKSVMKLYCKEGMRREAEVLIEELKDGKRLQDRAFFQSLLPAIKGKGNCGSLDQPSAVASELALILCLSDRDSIGTEERIKELLEAPNGLSVTNQLINKLAREGELSKAEYLYEMSIKLGGRPDDAACASLIMSYATQHKLEQATRLFRDVLPSSSNGKLLCSSMIEACNKLGKEEEAYLLYKEEMQKGNELGPVAISMLVNALTTCGRHWEAEDIIYDSFRLNSELDTVAYNTFIKAMLQAGKLHFAARIYERMLSSEVAPSIQTYNTMISVYGRCRNLDKAQEMFTTAHSMGIRIDEKTYSNLISYYGKAGKYHEASHLFDEMQKEGIKPGKVSYNIMLNVYSTKGLYHDAAELFQRMQDNGCSPDSFTYLSLIRAYSQGLQHREANKVISLMQEKGISLTCAHFNHVLLALTKAGSLTEAERIYKKITTARLVPNLGCNQTMLRGYIDYGYVEDGIAFFERINGNVEPDRFIMSAAEHLYKSAKMESEAETILTSMRDARIPFLEKLQVGSR